MPSQKYAAAISLAIVAAAMIAMPGSAAEKIDPAAYPELAPEVLLPAILAELRHTLPDIYSVREVRMCPAEHIKLRDGKPSDWSVRFEYNAKNASGGYAGIRRDAAIFRKERIAFPIGNSPQLGRDGLDSVFSRMVDKQMAACTAIPDAAVQQALAAAK